MHTLLFDLFVSVPKHASGHYSGIALLQRPIVLSSHSLFMYVTDSAYP